MAISANTTQPMRFLRRFSSTDGAPIKLFYAGDNSTSYRLGDAVKLTTAGKVLKMTTTTALNEFLGIVSGAAAEAPAFPSSAGVTAGGIVLTTGTVTVANRPPYSEALSICLALRDVIFVGNLTNNDADVTGVRATHIGRRFEILPRTPTGETARTVIEANAITNHAAFILDFHYPQIAQARSATAAADPFDATTTNMAVEFVASSGAFAPTA